MKKGSKKNAGTGGGAKQKTERDFYAKNERKTERAFYVERGEQNRRKKEIHVEEKKQRTEGGVSVERGQ